MKRRILPLIMTLVLTAGIIVGVTVFSFAEDTATNTTLPKAADGEVIDVWLVAGQSNAIGSAKVENYPTDTAYEEFKTLLTNGSQNVWHLRNTYTDFVPAGFSQGSGTMCGPELGITTALDKSANKNAIIKVAHGNTSLYNNTTSKESINYGTWTPPSYIEKHNINTVGNRTGDLYLTFIAKVAEGLEKLVEAGYTPNIKGVWYMQGEADTFGAASSGAYEELLTTLISDMRADLTDVSGMDCSELPFVYGRILRKDGIDPSTGESYMKKTPYVPTVQAAQDNVASNSSLKNVFMINTTTDLVDPVTHEHRLPVQQDGWHYDSLSQQMIGEKFVSLASSESRILTKYGYIPKAYEDSEKYPFALFKKVGGGYVFDSVSEYNASDDSSWATVMTRAITLTKSNGTAVTDEAVVLLRRDLDTSSFLKHTSDIGKTVTVDLDGYSFTTRTSFCNTKTDDCLASGATVAENGVINVKNGTLLMGDYGILYAAKNGTYTKEKTLTFNFENLNIGFADNAKTTCKTLLGIAYDSHIGEVVAKYEMNFVNCTIDSVTNCPTDSAYRLADLDASGESTENGYNNAVSITFKGCEIKIKDAKHLEIPMSAEGDSITFLKDDNGNYSKVVLPTGTYMQPFDEIGTGIETAYGTIPADKAEINSNPIVVFKKTDGAYVFDSTVKTIPAAFERAQVLANVKSGAVTDDVVILVRKYIADYGSFPSNVADIGGTVTLDLNGQTVVPVTTLIRTDFDDDGVVDGVQKKTTVNVKNGTLVMRDFGLIFHTVTSTSYTVPKTMDINVENVNFSFHKDSALQTENRKAMDLLISDRNTSSTTKSYINLKAINCTFDLVTNARDIAVLGTLDCGNSDKDKNDYRVEIIGGTIITDDIAKVSCHIKGNGDSVTFGKNSEGNYPNVLMRQNLTEPASTEYRIGENGVGVCFAETLDRVGIYKVYDMREDVVTKYGIIPYAASVNDFAVFVRNGSDAYTYYGAYSGWKNAFEAARTMTNGSSEAYQEAVVFMLRDSTETGVPYHEDASGIINVDLNGKKLIVKGSFFNTYLVSSNAPTSVINVFNGTINTYKYGLIYTAIKKDDTSYETAGVEKKITLNFNDVALGFEEYTDGTNAFLTAYAYNGSATLNMTVNMNFENCNFDLVNNAATTTLLGRGKSTVSTTTNTNTVDFNLAFTGCEFFVYSPSQISMSMSESGDSFVINKSSDGKYATVITKTANEEVYADIIAGNNGKAAVKLRTNYVGQADGHAKYELVETDGNITVVTDYGTIPADYVNIAKNPFVVFYKNESGVYTFKGGYDSYKSAMTAAIGLTTAAVAAPSSEAVVLLRSDWSGGAFPSNLSNIATTVTIDLNGYTLGALESLGNTQTGDVKDPDGNIVKTNGTINYKNGKLLMKVHPGLYIQGTDGGCTSGYQKTLNVNYDNVYIGMAEGAKNIALLGRIVSKITTENAYFNLKYTNCTIDMATNYSTGSPFYIGNWAPSSGADKAIVTVDFVDCNFIGLTEKDFQHRTTSGQDVVRYSRTDGNHYATLTLPKSAAAPAGVYSIGDSSAKFVKISESETQIVYALVPAEVADVKYSPKVSLTLDTNIVFNVYIPVNSTLEFTLNGKKYANLSEIKDIVVLDDGKNYYHFKIELAAAEAAKDIALEVSINAGTRVADGTFILSPIKYAQKLIVLGTDVEKTLAKDVLVYIKAAYEYFTGFNTPSEIERVSALVESIIGDYSSVPESVGTTKLAEGIESVTLNLDSKPTVRFYVTDTTLKFYINGKKVNTVSGEEGGKAYIELDAYAYALANTIAFGNGGSYHISSYVAGVKGTSHEALTNAFVKYVESSNAYRNSIIG